MFSYVTLQQRIPVDHPARQCLFCAFLSGSPAAIDQMAQ